jgi:Skp family chaperone for outer membrane proteins
MTKSFFASSIVTAAVLLIASAPSGVSAAPTPAPKIVVIDRSAVMRASKVGQDIVRQINAYTDQAEKDLRGQGAALQKDGAAFQRQAAILSNDVKSRKLKELEARRAGLQAQAQKKQNLIQGGFIKARQQVEQALGPILQGIMAERGANILLDRNAVVMGTDRNLDVTLLAVERLNQKMPSLKVELVLPPPGMQQQLQQPQPQQ